MKNLLLLVILLSFTLSLKAGEGNHHVAVFGGVTMINVEEIEATTLKTKDVTKSYPTVGIDYIYNTGMFSNKLGIGLLAEAILKDKFNAYILGIPFSYKSMKSFKIFVVPSLEFLEETVELTAQDTLDGKEAGETEMKSKFLFRIGLAYDFHIGEMSVSPTVATDFVDGHQTYLLGIALGYSF